jgi:hypothetical protein
MARDKLEAENLDPNLAVSSFILLRFFVIAVCNPLHSKVINAASQSISEGSRRGFTLVGMICNKIAFGAKEFHEPHLKELEFNKFLEEHSPRVHEFVSNVCLERVEDMVWAEQKKKAVNTVDLAQQGVPTVIYLLL